MTVKFKVMTEPCFCPVDSSSLLLVCTLGCSAESRPHVHYLMCIFHTSSSETFQNCTNSLVHVEEDVSAAVTVSLDASLLRARHVQVVVRQPRLLLHVIHVADVVTWEGSNVHLMVNRSSLWCT